MNTQKLGTGDSPLKEVLPACFESWEDWSEPPVGTFEVLVPSGEDTVYKCLRSHKWQLVDGRWKWFKDREHKHPCNGCPFRSGV